MNFPTRIEQELFDHLSPDKQAEVEEHYAGLEEPPGHDFIMERAKLEADREDAADAQHERARENFEAQMGKLRGMAEANQGIDDETLGNEAAELMTRPPMNLLEPCDYLRER